MGPIMVGNYDWEWFLQHREIKHESDVNIWSPGHNITNYGFAFCINIMIQLDFVCVGRRIFGKDLLQR
jgi:hypothetical protein